MQSEELINLVYDNRCLWDINDKDYHNKGMARKKWEKISQEMNCKEEAVKMRWRSLRDTFHKEWRKLTKDTPDGKAVTWPHFKSMLFLKEQNQSRNKDNDHTPQPKPDPETLEEIEPVNTFDPYKVNNSDDEKPNICHSVVPNTHPETLITSSRQQEFKRKRLSSEGVYEEDDSDCHFTKSLTKSWQPQEISSLTVNELQNLKFSQLSLPEKLTVKKRGRFTPDILISQPGISNNKKYIRSFNSEWYQRKSWLCGCEVKNALFCFPCLLFGGDVTWTKDGFRNINKMKEKTEKHEKSKQHIDNVISLTLLGTVNITEKLSEAHKLSVNEYNKKVKKNREILSKIIDCIFFYGNMEAPLHGHDHRDDSVNPGVIRGLVNFASTLDADLKNHLETSAIFKGFSKTIQNEILDCLLQVYHEEIRTEIKKASFVAVMADDTTDVSEHTHMVLVLRYLLNGEIFERFWGFFIPDNQTADGISKCILEQLEIILQGNGQRLIALTFDGANVMKGEKAVVRAKIKAVYSNAHFIHSYVHNINLILRNAASITRNTRIFFSNVLAISTFFLKSQQRLSVLKKHVDVSILHPSPTMWTVNTVYENLQLLKNCLIDIQSTSNADQTIAEATGILKYLNDDDFKFWLELFHQMMPHVEIIHNQMQSLEISVLTVNECMANFKTAILELRNSKYCESSSKTLTAESKEVCDYICVDILDRYSSTKHLVAAKLLNKKCFTSFKKEHPSEEIILTSEAYPMIDKEKLETELKVFYSRSDIHKYSSLIELLKFILDNYLDDVLSEILKLIKILLTVPMTTREPERCFSTLNRIKTFLSTCTMNLERLNALGVLSIKKNFLSCHPEIKEKIIDFFAQIETRRIDFIFK